MESLIETEVHKSRQQGFNPKTSNSKCCLTTKSATTSIPSPQELLRRRRAGLFPSSSVHVAYSSFAIKGAGGPAPQRLPGVERWRWPEGVVTYSGGGVLRFLEFILADMVREGVIEQEQVDSFNVPNVYPCVKDLRRVVERNGCFQIVKMEFRDIP
ncbi:loganic acid O-methyltransferase-like [Salvia divinorum]|uniref:Loganic acid O-methyltransferase-like n=1 Tax=Salvia divinorum TaxID=28513 RepID=A0ABD1FI96_SALDI